MENKTRETVPIELGVRMGELRIWKRKSDGRFSFKLKCPVCGKIEPGWCWCADTLEKAIRVVETRTSPYACSSKCWFQMDDWWMGNDHEITAFLNDLGERFRNKPIQSLFAMKGKHPRIYHRLQKKYASVYDGGGDEEPYEDEDLESCDCEVRSA